MKPYCLSDVVRSHHWLNHQPHFTEICLLPPLYRPDDPSWNYAHRVTLRSHYITTTKELVGLVREYAGTHMVCYGFNPRPAIRTATDGTPRPAKEHDIPFSQSFPLELDLLGTVTPARVAALNNFLTTADEY
jgi:hypothetical protein